MAAQISPGADLSKIPAGVPPPGVTPNLVDPPSLRPATIGVAAVMIVLALVFVFFGLLEHRKNLKVGDYTTIIALVLSIGYSGVIIALSQYAVHIWDLPISAFTVRYLKLLYTAEMLIGPTVFFAKTSIFLLYLNIFRVNNPTKWAIYFGMALNFAIYWPNIAINSYYNAPHAGEDWDVAKISERSRKPISFSTVQGVMAVVIDLYIFIIPLPVLARLNMRRGKKIQVIAVFGTAVAGIVASVVSLVYRVKLVTAADSTWTFSAQFICTIVEDFVAIIISVMPPFAGYFKAISSDPTSTSGWSLRSRIAPLFGMSSSKKMSTGASGYKGSEFSNKSGRSAEQSNAYPAGRSESVTRLTESHEPYELRSFGGAGDQSVNQPGHGQIGKTVDIEQEERYVGSRG